MTFENTQRLENLSVRADGLVSMTQALRDCFIEGPNAPKTYNGAIHLLSDLMYEFNIELNDIVQSVCKERKK